MAEENAPGADAAAGDAADAASSSPVEKPAAARTRAAAKKPAVAKADAAEKPARTRAAAKKPAADKTPAPVRAPRSAGAKKPAEPAIAAAVAAEAAAPTEKAPAKATAAPRTARRGAAAKESAKRMPADFTVRAHARYVRSSARKARLVCNHIRGKSVPEARAVLAFAPRGVAKDWSKLLNSAVANAENNHELIGDELRVTAVYADEGPTLKRFKPRAMGRATPIHKRTSHLTIELGPKG
jgi:ribosomal protein L22